MSAACYECGDKGCAVCEPDQTAWDDLRERLISAVDQIEALGRDSLDNERITRLYGKREGVKLALSYMDEWDRSHG